MTGLIQFAAVLTLMAGCYSIVRWLIGATDGK